MVTLTYQERFKTLKGVFDEFTNRTLFELQSKGLFDELVNKLAFGKESGVFVGVMESGFLKKPPTSLARKGKRRTI